MSAGQIDLFEADAAIADEARPLAANADPITSKISARAMVESGELGRQQAEVLAALKRWPNTTSDELARFANLDRYLVARRLPDLGRLGLAKKDGRRTSSVSGRPAVIWVAAK